MRKKYPGAKIASVAPHSLASRLGLKAGDRILKLNGKRIPDLIAYQLEEAEDKLYIEVEKADGEYWELEVEKEEEEGLGATFHTAVFDGIKPCCNHCLFCFVDQMPPKQRASLYIKDDDYRLSFLQGSYITLTNLTDADWQRIADYRLSPLYISVHATEPKVRRELLGNKQASAIMPHLQRLAEWGCHFHAQAVLCPGINDGAVLEKTIADLEKFWPYLRTFALVPVGLTRHRAGLAPLRKFKPTEAAAVIDITHRAQQRFLSLYGSRLVFAADEFYLQADQKFPPLETYEDLLQLENGVGLWPLFKTQFLTALTEAYREGKKKPDRNFAVITGRGAAQLWQELSQAVAKKFPWLKLSVLPVRNHFFGDEVTVTGLVTGADIQSALREAQLRTDTCLLLPLVMLRHQEDVFLDGMTVDELRASVPFSIKVVGVNGEEAVKALLE